MKGKRTCAAWLLLAALAWPVQTHAQESVAVKYTHTDALGTPLAVTDENGDVIERFEYEPYGLQVAGPVEDGPGYTGHVEDMLTGMVYMQQRYYDPYVERFLSVDPVTAYSNPRENFNRYWYANDNPFKFKDSDGRESGAGYATGEYTMATPNVSWVDIGNAIVSIGCGCDATYVAPAGSGELQSSSYPGEALISAGGGAARLAGRGAAQTGEQIVTKLANNAIKDDVKGNVRQIVKSSSQLRQDAKSATSGGKTGASTPTPSGSVQTASHDDGTTVSVRMFSGRDGTGPATIQVNPPNTKKVVKIRYDDQ